MNRARLIVAAALACAAAVACADIVGIIDVPDGSTGVICTQDDAAPDTTCLGSIPSGWTPVGAAVAPTAQCPGDAGDFVQSDLITNPHFGAGACACGSCTASGSWSCGEGEVDVGPTSCPQGQSGLTNSTYCYSTTYFSFDAGAGYIQAKPPALVFTTDAAAACHVDTTGAQKMTTDAVRLCRPTRCEADFCGLQNHGFSVCITHPGAVACPSPFVPLKNTTKGEIADAGNATGGCNACSCKINEAGAGTSSLTFSLYNNASCSGSSITTTSGACQFVDAAVAPTVQGFFYQPACTPSPTATCFASSADPGGDASLFSPSTVCCTPN